MMSIKHNGCSFGEVSRNMIENLTKDYYSFKLDIKKEFDELRSTNTKLYNHLSSRLPPWATVLMAFAFSTITGLIVWGVNR